MKVIESRGEKKGRNIFWAIYSPEMGLYTHAQEREAIMSVEAQADAAHREQ